jgi:hypothetical protein
MATCEFHDKYAEYVAQQGKMPLVDGRLKFWGWDAVKCALDVLKTSEFLEQITHEEAQNLSSEIFTLYPQFADKIKEELSQPLG